MELYKLEGRSGEFEFTTPNGVKVEGENFYFTTVISDGRGEGRKALKVFLKKEVLKKIDSKLLVIGNEVHLIYNQFGKVVSILPAGSVDVVDF